MKENEAMMKLLMILRLLGFRNEMIVKLQRRTLFRRMGILSCRCIAAKRGRTPWWRQWSTQVKQIVSIRVRSTIRTGSLPSSFITAVPSIRIHLAGHGKRCCPPRWGDGTVTIPLVMFIGSDNRKDRDGTFPWLVGMLRRIPGLEIRSEEGPRRIGSFPSYSATPF